MNSPEQIDEHCVLKTEAGRSAVQYVFHDDEGQEFLEELPGRNLVVYPITAKEFNQWEAEREGDFDNRIRSEVLITSPS